MSTYELAFLSENTQSAKKLEEVLNSFKGKKVKEESMGKKALAYPIDKKTVAEFIVWHIELDKKQVKPFKQKLNFDHVVLRYLLLETKEVKQKVTKKTHTK